MTISKRDAKLLLILLGIIILLMSYLAVYNPYLEKIEAVEAETAALRPELEKLQGYYQNLNVYQAGIDSASETMTAELANYPSDIRAEDLIMYAVSLENKVGVKVTGITFSEPQPILSFQTISETSDGGWDAVDLTAYRTGMTVSCSLGYQALKDMADYLADTQYRTALDTVSVSFNSESGELIGTAGINKYFVASGTEDYQATEVPKVSIGTDDIFSTIGITASGQE